MFEKEAKDYCLKRTGYGQDEFHGRKLRQAYQSGAEFGYNKANEILKSSVKVLISTLDDTLWDEGHPGYSDSEPGYNCPERACKDCYRVSCEYNKSELFKQLNTDFPELFKRRINKCSRKKQKNGLKN